MLTNEEIAENMLSDIQAYKENIKEIIIGRLMDSSCQRTYWDAWFRGAKGKDLEDADKGKVSTYAGGGEVYEIYGYQTLSDYEGRNPSYLDEGITSKKDARSLAKEHLDEYYIVKVQSMDRDDGHIELFGGVDGKGSTSYAEGGEVTQEERAIALSKRMNKEQLLKYWEQDDWDKEGQAGLDELRQMIIDEFRRDYNSKELEILEKKYPESGSTYSGGGR